MNRTDAVSLAVNALKANGITHYVLRRGDKYDVGILDRKGWKVAEMIGPGNVQNFEHIQPPPPVLISGNPTIHKTRFKELGYWHLTGRGTNLWQCVALDGDKPAQVGTQYATEKELLANLEAYATEYGCDGANPRPDTFQRVCQAASDARAQGYAVVIFTPEELEGASVNLVQNRLVELGWEVISDLKPENDDPANRSRDDAGAADPRNDRED